MAGSYSHCTRDDGSFCFSGMIESMRDASEACEEMQWLINYLADGDVEKIKEALKAYVNQPKHEEYWFKKPWKLFDATKIRNYGA